MSKAKQRIADEREMQMCDELNYPEYWDQIDEEFFRSNWDPEYEERFVINYLLNRPLHTDA